MTQHPRSPVTWSSERHLTRRGVLWLGLRCDVRCKFCYDDRVLASRKGWLEAADAIAALDKFRSYYGNEFVDSWAGSPPCTLGTLLRPGPRARPRPGSLLGHGPDFDRACALAAGLPVPVIIAAVAAGDGEQLTLLTGGTDRPDKARATGTAQLPALVLAGTETRAIGGPAGLSAARRPWPRGSRP